MTSKMKELFITLLNIFLNIFRENGTPFETSSYSSMIVFRFFQEREPDSSDLYLMEKMVEPE